MSTFMLRTIDPGLWSRVKARAALDNINLRRLFYWLLEIYASKGLKVFEQAAGHSARPPAEEQQAGRTGAAVAAGHSRAT